MTERIKFPRRSPRCVVDRLALVKRLSLLRTEQYRTIIELSIVSQIYFADFDEDGLLGTADLARTCRQLVQGGLAADEVDTICRKVLEESDIDGDGALSYLEFEHVVTRASDFLSTFHIRI